MFRFAGASRAMPGQRECGDQFGIETRDDMTTLVLADGLGHGSEAALVAKRVVEIVRQESSRPLADILAACHADLRGTRGAAVTLVRCAARESTLTHCGVGNVELTVLTLAPVRPITTAGIVGVRARKFLETKHRLASGDLLLLYTDGISSRLLLDPFRGLDAKSVADAILAHHAKEHDDAACIVIRC